MPHIYTKRTFLMKSIKWSKSLLLGVAIFGGTMSMAHSELTIEEKDPESSIINRFENLKDAELSDLALHELVNDLNNRLSANPKDSLAWGILAQIYYENGYDDYALYAANEAIDLGYNTTKLKRILLNSSVVVAENQLREDYLVEGVDEDFIKEYQYSLSRIYGEVYGFNYDESLPKAVAPVVRPKAKVSTSTVKRRPVSTARRRAPTPAPKKRVSSPPKPKTTPVARPKVIVKPKSTTTPKTTGASSDPFKILRQP